MVYPTTSHQVNCSYGVRGPWAAGYHTGIDYEAHYNPVYATKGGTVVLNGTYDHYGPDYGLHLVLSSVHEGHTIQHLYAHLSATRVRVGQKVKAGDLLGTSGNTGNTTGPHLHYEERHSPYGYYDHQRPVLPYYQPDTRPVIHLHNLGLGKKNDDVLKLKKRLNKFFPKRRPLFGKRYTKVLRKRYAAYQRFLGFSERDANGVPGKVSLEKLGFKVLG